MCFLIGLETETDYHYDGMDEKCHFEKSKVKINEKDIKMHCNRFKFLQGNF